MMNKNVIKVFVLALTLAASISFTACSSKEENTESNAENTPAGDPVSGEPVSGDPVSGDPVSGDSDSENTASSNEETGLFSTMDTLDMDGEKADFSLFSENKLTFVNLWNVGCTPCVQEIPVLETLNNEYEGKGVTIKGLYFYPFGSKLPDEERKAIEDILESAGATYQQLLLSDDMTNHEIIQNIQAFPTTFVVDSDGNILNTIIGSSDYDGWKERIENELEKAEKDA